MLWFTLWADVTGNWTFTSQVKLTTNDGRFRGQKRRNAPITISVNQLPSWFVNNNFCTECITKVNKLNEKWFIAYDETAYYAATRVKNNVAFLLEITGMLLADFYTYQLRCNIGKQLAQITFITCTEFSFYRVCFVSMKNESLSIFIWFFVVDWAYCIVIHPFLQDNWIQLAIGNKLHTIEETEYREKMP